MAGDPFLRRFERTAILACLSMAVIAFVIGRGDPGPAIAVLGGGLLIAVSYWTIGSGIGAWASAVPSSSAPDCAASGSPRNDVTLPRIAAKVTLRYALLALLAYVMIARLHLHPVGLLAGASSVVAAASVEAFRLLLKKS
jgi:hypothetical protein